MRSLGRTPTDAEVQQIVAKVDQNNNGVIEFDEFVRLMAAESLNVPRPGVAGKPYDELYRTFMSFDQDGNGKISKSELGAVMNKLGDRLTPDELQEMIKAADLDGDSQIDFAGKQ